MWTTESGAARHITLLSRTGKPAATALEKDAQATSESAGQATPQNREEVQWSSLTHAGISLHVVAADVSYKQDALHVMSGGGFANTAALPAYTAVLHAAGVLEDAMLNRQDLDKIRR